MPRMLIPAGLPLAVVEELKSAFFRVQNIVSGRRVWERLFTSAERLKLGNDFLAAWPDGGIVTMWMRIRGVSAHRAVIDMARLLNLMDEQTHRWLLAETGEMSDDPEEALAIALSRSNLVLTEVPRSVYWKGVEIEIDWEKHQALWVYLLTLAAAAKRGEWIDASDFSKSRKRDYQVKIKSRLTGMENFPTDLADAIVSHAGGQQLLDLPRQTICILEAVNKLAVRELV